MRVALFARYSSKLQDEMSLEAQIYEMEQFVGQHPGWQIVHRVLLPETRSSDVEEAPEFRELLRLAKAREFDLLLVHKLDRFGRNREFAAIYKATLRRAGVEIRSVAENLGDTTIDRAMEGMLEIMADFYSHNLAAETRKGHRQLTRKGLWTGGTVPFGYKAETVLDGSRTRRKLVPDVATAPVMREVFEMAAKGYPSSRIIARVQELTGAKWALPSLYTRIKNPIYYGVAEYGKTTLPPGRRRKPGQELTTGEVEPIVSRETWDMANEVLRSRGRRSSGSSTAKEVYLLSQLGRCMRCGGAIVGSRESGRPRYNCVNRRGGGCTYASVGQEQLELLVLEQLVRYLGRMDADRLSEAYRESLKPMRAEAIEREKRLRKRLTETRAKIKNVLAAIEQGILFDDLADRVRALKDEEAELAQAIGTCQLEAEQVYEINTAVVAEWLGNVLGRLEEKDPADVTALLKHVVGLELDLKEKKGQLTIQLPLFEPEPAEAFPLRPRVKSGRSARTILRPRFCQVLVPLDWAA